MKKILNWVLVMCLLVNVFALPVRAEISGTCGDNLTWTLDDGVLTISGEGDMYDYGYNYNTCPWGRSNVEYVVIENGVTSIGDGAFSYNYYLTDITIPNSVTSIGEYSFYWCESLTSIEIPNSVTSIGASAFRDCYAESITIGSGVESIGDYAFSNCKSLTGITIPNGVTSIGKSAFSYCSNITSIAIPNSVTSIGESAFSSCESLTNITLSDKITSIEENTFSSCKSLTGITIPDSVTSIGEDAFYDCKSLLSVTIGSGIENIDRYGFYYCENLEKVIISDLSKWCDISFENDESNPLYYAHNLYLNDELVTDVTIPEGTTNIKNYIFSGCESLTSVSLPNSLKKIGNSSFYKCKNLTEITIPKNVTQIDKFAFSGCGKLNINVDNANRYYYSEDGVLFYSDSIYCYSKDEINPKYEIPDSVTWINEAAFFACSNLTEVTIPNTVTKIEDRAFTECEALKNIVIHDNVTRIGEHCFDCCTNLESVTLGNGITEIPEYAFRLCEKLKEINIPENVTEIGYDAFFKCSSLEKIVIPKKVKKISSGIYGCEKLTDVYYEGTEEEWNEIKNGYEDWKKLNIHYNYVGNGKYKDGYYTYEVSDDKATITSVDESISGDITIPSKLGGYDVVYIGYGSFAGCDKITSVIMPNSIEDIHTYAFMNCTSLKSIRLSTGIKELHSAIFHTCTSLEEIFIPNGVEIEYYNVMVGTLFVDCKKLTKISVSDDNPDYTSVDGILFNKDKTILVGYPTGKTEKSYEVPGTVKEIGDGAFESNENIETLIIPNGVEKIGFGSLWCDNLKELYLPKSLTFIGGYSYVGREGKCDVYYDGSYSDFHKIEGYMGTFVNDAVIHYNANLQPINAEITMTETEEKCSFTVEPDTDTETEEEYEDCYVFVAVYDENGLLVGIKKELLDASENTTVTVEKGDNASTAKVFIMADSLLPLITPSEYTLN